MAVKFPVTHKSLLTDYPRYNPTIFSRKKIKRRNVYPAAPFHFPSSRHLHMSTLYSVFQPKLKTALSIPSRKYNRLLVLPIPEVLHQIIAVSPVFLHLHPQFQVHSAVQHPLDLIASRAADLLEHAALFSDDDSFM